MQPEGWHGALITAWRDQLHNDAVLNIAVVFPELRALRGTPPVHADLILTQGGPEQAGGITTVFPLRPMHRAATLGRLLYHGM